MVFIAFYYSIPTQKHNWSLLDYLLSSILMTFNRMVISDNINLSQLYSINMKKYVQLGLKCIFYVSIDCCDDKKRMFDHYIHVQNDKRRFELSTISKKERNKYIHKQQYLVFIAFFHSIFTQQHISSLLDYLLSSILMTFNRMVISDNINLSQLYSINMKKYVQL